MNRIAIDPDRLAARAGRRLLFFLAAVLVAGLPVVGQEMGPPRPPLVPLLEPRPAELPGPGNQLQTVRPAEEKQPIASFLKSLQGSDATIEVIVGQARLLTTRQPIATERGAAVVAVGDPSVVDFEVLPNPRMIRLIGKRPGVTDLSIITADEQT
jgi:Flp pilus assembly secretin CpaC